jgi:hypothetical protein
MTQANLKKLIQLLKPDRNFPYGLNVLRAIINISKSSNNPFYDNDLYGLLYDNNQKLIDTFDFNRLLTISDTDDDYANNNSGYFIANNYFDFCNENDVS